MSGSPFAGCGFCRLTRYDRLRSLEKQGSLLRRFMQPNPAGQLTEVVAEMHDEARDQHGPKANRQRDLIV